VARARVGASALAQVFGAVGDAAQCPDADDARSLVAAFDVLQELLAERALLALHDRSDGGAAVAALEMAFAGNVGVDLHLPAPPAGTPPLHALFAEELGWLAQVRARDAPAIVARFAAAGVLACLVGGPAAGDAASLRVGGATLFAGRMTALRDAWESTSIALEALQAAPACVAAERDGMARRRAPPYALTFVPAPTPPALLASPHKPRVVVLREEGSNGDREMGAALYAAGFEAWDVTISDLASGRFDLAAASPAVRGLVFPGGFSYADVLDSAKGWAGAIRFNAAVAAQISAFYARPDTFTLGVCNGCQLAALLGFVPFGPQGAIPGAGAAGAGGAGARVTDASQPRFVRNASERFESRFPAVRVADSPAIMLRGMAGSVLGVWSQHGEGRLHFPDAAVEAAVLAARCVPLTYVDDDGADTEAYPFNPNGSPRGIAGLCSPDGRHLAIMPHPERVHLLWQWPYLPPDWAGLAASPWLRMFQNARYWCDSVPDHVPAPKPAPAS
jgi:phosphoribosylformylglycinamidine synthase